MIKHFLSLTNFSNQHIHALIDRAHFFSLHSKLPDKIDQTLKDKIFANIFYEPSTRTRCSFEMAAKKLGANIINFVPENSSVKKGESVYDTLKTIEALGVDGMIIRHSDDHLLEELQNKFKTPLINAGAGKNEHPSQCLLDLFTLHQEFKKLNQLKIAICGDVKHSRVAQSMMGLQEKMGLDLYLSGPPHLLPVGQKVSFKKAEFDHIISEVDAIMMLRIQLERHGDLQMDEQIYHQQFGLTDKRISMMKEGAIIMHPGPFNRGVEISNEAVEHPKSRIFQQVSNGVYTRMAILESVIKGFGDEKN